MPKRKKQIKTSIESSSVNSSTQLNIVLGISAGIAAYKMYDLVSDLKKQGHNVNVILTEDAKNFVSELTFKVLSGNPV